MLRYSIVTLSLSLAGQPNNKLLSPQPCGSHDDGHGCGTRGREHSVWFAQPDALIGSIVNTLNEVRPTIFFGVPRVWEKFKDKVDVATSGAILTSKLTCSANPGYKGMCSLVLLPCLVLSDFSSLSFSSLLYLHTLSLFLVPS